MSSLIVKFVTKKIFNETHLNKFGTEDPYYEEIRLNELDKSVKKVKKRAPVGVSQHDVKVYEKVKRRAYRLELLFSLFGVRLGISHIIGVIPVVGDILNIFLALLVFRLCLRVEGGLPLDVQLKMLLNIAIDFAIGLIPIVGDLVEIYYKCNSRNLLLLEKHLVQVGEVNMGKRDHVSGIQTSDVVGYVKKVNNMVAKKKTE